MALDSYAAGTLLILASGLLAVLGLLAVRRAYNVRTLIAAHEISGQYLSIVGTMYAVLLGLIVVDAMSRFQQANIVVEEEANSLSEMVYLSGRMPPPQRAQVQQRASNYARLVVDQEWVTMAQGRLLPAAQHSAIDLMKVVRDWEPVTESEKTVYGLAVSAATSFWSNRRERIVICQRRIPQLEWCLVVLGGAVTVGLTYVFVFDDLRIQITLTAMVALLIALNIFLILMFGYPFSGELCVSSEGFQIAVATESMGSPLTGPR